MNQYTHRNGETDEPIVEGWYWFDGVERWGNCQPLRKWTVFVEREDEGGSVYWYGAEDDADYACADGWLHGQWWGPIVAPWQVVA